MLNNLDALVAFIVMVVTGISSWFAGKKAARTQPIAEAVQTVQLMRAEIDTLKSRLAERDQEIAELRGRLRAMEDMVTQRADVDGVRQIVNRIAERILGDDA